MAIVYPNLKEPTKGTPIDADWGKEVVKAIKSLSPVAGNGIMIDHGPNGTKITSTSDSYHKQTSHQIAPDTSVLSSIQRSIEIHTETSATLSTLSGDAKLECLQLYGFDDAEPCFECEDLSALSAMALVRIPLSSESEQQRATLGYVPLSAVGGYGWVTNAPQGAYDTTNYSYDAKVTVLYFGPIS